MEPNTDMVEGDTGTQMTETQQQSSPPVLDEEQFNKKDEEKEDKGTMRVQVDEEIIQSYPGKINAEEKEKEVEDPIKLQVEMKPEIGEEQVIEIHQLELEEKEKEKEKEEEREETDIVNVEQQQQQQHEDEDDEMEGPPPGWDSLLQLPPSPQPEMGQMVCGSCRHLLSYPQGSKHVRCSCCLTVNYVLEEHQVGQVKCEMCAVLLMYPFGAQSVRCCSCCSVINIGDHNKRPSLSVQQSRACRPFSIGH